MSSIIKQEKTRKSRIGINPLDVDYLKNTKEQIPIKEAYLSKNIYPEKKKESKCNVKGKDKSGFSLFTFLKKKPENKREKQMEKFKSSLKAFKTLSQKMHLKLRSLQKKTN